MNIHKFLYRHIWLLLLLFASCSQDEIVPSIDDMTGGSVSTGVAPISISLQSGAGNGATKAIITEDDLYDDIDEVQILVYKRTKNTQEEFSYCDSEKYIFSDKEGQTVCSGGKITCTDGTPYRKAEAFFIPPANEKENSEYRLYAIAYNKDRWANVTLHLSGKKLFYCNEILDDKGNLQIPNIENSDFAYMELSNGDYSRLDFFAGSVGYDFSDGGKGLTEAEKQMYAKDYIDGSTSQKLAGKLRRATGRISFHLTNIPTEYEKICLVVDGYTTKSLIGLGDPWENHKNNEVNGGDEEVYPWLHNVFGYGWEKQTGNPANSDTWVTVAEADLSGGQTTADLYVDCLPAMGFKVYVQPYKNGQVAGTYRIHCAAKRYYPGYIGIMDWAVDEEGLFTVLVNNWAKLEGEFNRLDNMKIDLGWGDDYQGPVLGQD